MLKVALVRGKHLNNYEGQNYLFDSGQVRLTAIGSLNPIDGNFPFPVISLPSPADIPIFTSAVKYLANRLIGDMHYLYRLNSLKDKFDIFHTADPYYFFSYQLAKLRQRKLIKKLIFTSWETIAFNNETVEKKKRIKYFSIGQADLFICHTEKAKQVLLAEGVKPDKIRLVRLGVDINKFKRSTINFKQKNDLTILFVGRLAEEKGVTDLYETYKRLKMQRSKIKSKTQNLKLRIIGQGGLENNLRTGIADDGLSDDVSLEKKDYFKMPRVYREADVLVLPAKTTKTWEEQYGMVLIEAMACGLPIVAYNSGAIGEVIGGAGILVKEGSGRDLASAIKRLIENRAEREKLGKMGRYRAIKYFAAGDTAERLKQIYLQIAG